MQTFDTSRIYYAARILNYCVHEEGGDSAASYGKLRIYDPYFRGQYTHRKPSGRLGPRTMSECKVVEPRGGSRSRKPSISWRRNIKIKERTVPVVLR